MYKQDYDSEQSTKIYTRTELVTIETTISHFYTSFYITDNPEVGVSHSSFTNNE